MDPLHFYAMVAVKFAPFVASYLISCSDWSNGWLFVLFPALWSLEVYVETQIESLAKEKLQRNSEINIKDFPNRVSNLILTLTWLSHCSLLAYL